MTYTPYYPEWKDHPDLTTPVIAAALENIEAGIAAAAAGGSSLTINVMDYGADNTGVDYNDTAFADAIAAAVAIGYPYPMITGPKGTYNFGGYSSLSGGTYKGPSLALPSGIQFGGFGGGAYGCATFSFPETLQPTAFARVNGSTVTAQSTLPLKNCKNAFAPASVDYPQYAHVSGFGTITYTGITGSGLTPTLTGVTGLIGDAVDALCAGNASVLLSSGLANRMVLDQSIIVSGPFTGTRNLWCPCATLNGSVASNAGTIAVTAVAGTLPSSGQVMIVGPNGQYCITYTGYSGGNLTGCTTANDTATLPSGASVFYITPPTAVDGIYMGSGSVDCSVTGFRHGTVTAADHNHWGPNFYASLNYSHVCLEGPANVDWVQVDSGNHHFQAPMKWEGAYWANLYVTYGNALLASWFDGRQQSGSSPWWCWKEAVTGVTGANGTIFDQNCYVSNVMQEDGGLGFIGCPDGGSSCSATFVGCQISLGGQSPGNLPIVAEFACNMTNFRIIGPGMTGGNASTTNPWILGSYGYGTIEVNPSSLHPFALRPILGRVRIGVTSIYKILFPGGAIVAGQNANVPSAGTICANLGSQDEGNYPGISKFDRDRGAAASWGAPAGISATAFSSNSDSPTRDVGVIITGQQWGQIAVKCRSGVITAGDVVRSDGPADPGYAKRWTTGDDIADGQIIGVALSSESGGFATINISPAFS